MSRTYGQRAGVAVYESGVRAFISSGRGRPPGSGGRRGAVTRFSPGSRRRMRDRLLTYSWGSITGNRRALWVTFTARAGTASQFKVWLAAFAKRFFRRHPRGWFVWRLEYQTRGVPHLHLIVVYPAQAAAMAHDEPAWLVHTWRSIAGFDNTADFAQCVKVIRGIWGIAAYISDATKVQQGFPVLAVDVSGEVVFDQPGRWWGVRGDIYGNTVGPACLDRCYAVMIYNHCLVTEFRRFTRALRRARWRYFGRGGRVPPVRDCVEFFDTQGLFRLPFVFKS